MSDLIYKEECYKIVGACFEVYKLKGVGFTEPLSQECLEIEFGLQGIPFAAQPELQVDYKGTLLEYERIVNSRNLAKTQRAGTR